MPDPVATLIGLVGAVVVIWLLSTAFSGAAKAEEENKVPMAERNMLNSNILNLGVGGFCGWVAGIFLVFFIGTLILLALAR